jgi:glycogen operon protein
MLLAGDELGHSQNGNNNAYCQDNEITWLSWELNHEQIELLEFTRKVIALAKAQAVFQRRRFFHQRREDGRATPEIEWLSPDGKPMTDQAWNDHHVRCLGVHLRGGRIEVDEYGEPIIGDHILLLFNADHSLTIPFVLPTIESGEPWRRLFDTAVSDSTAEEIPMESSTYDLQPVSVVVFCAPVDVEVEQAFPLEESVAVSRTF